jgi:cytochrome d ubiquinol oxidase subunit I
VLPTHLSVSTLPASSLYFSLAGFILFYTLLLIIELFLMLKYIKLGPSSLYTGKYHFEKRPT